MQPETEGRPGAHPASSDGSPGASRSGRRNGEQMGEAIDLARLMLEHAKAGCWEEVARINVHSRAFSSEALTRLATGLSQDDRRVQVAELLRVLDQIRSLAESRRDAVKVDLIARSRGKRALAEYDECRERGLKAA